MKVILRKGFIEGFDADGVFNRAHDKADLYYTTRVYSRLHNGILFDSVIQH